MLLRMARQGGGGASSSVVFGFIGQCIYDNQPLSLATPAQLRGIVPASHSEVRWFNSPVEAKRIGVRHK